MSRFYYGNSSVTHLRTSGDTPRSETYFVQATYVPRTSYVTATFTWRFSDVSVFVWNFTFVCIYGVSRRMCYVRVMYVWRMKCTRDVGLCLSTAYVLPSILICCVSVLYQMFLLTIRTNGCVHFVHAICILQLSIIRGRGCHRRNLDNLD